MAGVGEERGGEGPAQAAGDALCLTPARPGGAGNCTPESPSLVPVTCDLRGSLVLLARSPGP